MPQEVGSSAPALAQDPPRAPASPTDQVRLNVSLAIERELAALEEQIAARYAPFRVADAGSGGFVIDGPRGERQIPALSDRERFVRALTCELNLAYAAGVVIGDIGRHGSVRP